VYAEVIRIAQPSESLEALACRLSLSLNRVLLAFADWRDQVEAQLEHTT
jgi:hypothetical protein